MALVSELIQIGLSPQQAEFLGDIQQNTITANGTTQGAATALTGSICRITTCTAGVNDAVLLPLVSVSKQKCIFIRNDTAAIAQVFPSSGDSINNLGANNPRTIAANSGAIFLPITTTQWIGINV